MSCVIYKIYKHWYTWDLLYHVIFCIMSSCILAQSSSHAACCGAQDLIVFVCACVQMCVCWWIYVYRILRVVYDMPTSSMICLHHLSYAYIIYVHYIYVIISIIHILCGIGCGRLYGYMYTWSRMYFMTCIYVYIYMHIIYTISYMMTWCILTQSSPQHAVAHMIWFSVWMDIHTHDTACTSFSSYHANHHTFLSIFVFA